MHHYPEIFEKAIAATDGPILSFGCSTGEEVRSLKSLTDRPVHGVEVCAERLLTCFAEDPDGVYAQTPEELQGNNNEEPPSYGLAFAMSVLCRYPGAPEEFPFEAFAHWVARLDALLAPSALLILWNANYDFRETDTFNAYDVEPFLLLRDGEGFDSECPVGGPGSGFLPKFSRSHEALGPVNSRAVPLAFRKRALPETVSSSRGTA
jgi:hypothetical protein